MARNHAFRVVIAYEDFACAIRAREMTERLAARMKPEIGITNEVWQFDSLRYSELRDEAASDAAAADMIFISTRGGAQLPVHITKWIESWLPQKRNSPVAVVALLDQAEGIPGQPPSPCAYLRQIAEIAGMDFFLKVGGWQQPGFQAAVETFRRQPEKPSPVSERVLNEAHPAGREWDINK